MRSLSTDASILRSESNVSPHIGLTHRRRQNCLESELVDHFVANAYTRIPDDRQLTLFVEPMLESGWPDIVAVLWNPAVCSSWTADRTYLIQSDLRLISFLQQFSHYNINELEYLFGHRVMRSLDRLFEADIIDKNSRRVSLKSLRRIYAVESIVTFEAKLKPSLQLYEQVIRNLWFATKSVAVLPTEAKAESFERYRLEDDFSTISLDRPTIPAGIWRNKSAPKSYISWMFNEWCWRASRVVESCDANRC